MRGFGLHGSSLLLLRMVAGKAAHLGPLSHPTSIGLKPTLSCFHPWQSTNYLGFWSRIRLPLHSKVACQSIFEARKAQDLDCGQVIASFSSTRWTANGSANSSVRNEDNILPDPENSAVLAENAQTERSTRPVSAAAEKSQSERSARPVSHAQTIRRSPVSWLSLVLLFITGAVVLYFFDKEKQRRIEVLKQRAEQDLSVGKAAIGCPFKLINHEGKHTTDQDFLGNWTLIYFGFTHCPDICPDELQKIVQAVDVIEKDSGIKITPVFISVDPERDNVEQIHEYVKEFHPRLVGLTGTANDIKEVARGYRVYYMKAEEDKSDYLVDHSTITYLMDPNMEFVKFFGKYYDVKSLSDEILKEIRKVNVSSTV
eukprot:c24390_g1_i1 orf=226-1335(+)